MRTLIRGGRVFDPASGEIADADIALDGEDIYQVGTGLDGDEEVDASGLTVLPGLIDAHVHVMLPYLDTVRLLETPFSMFFFLAEANLRRTLDCGITYVRDANGADLGVAQAVRSGLVDGPDLLITVQALSQTGGHGDYWLPSGCSLPPIPLHPGRPSGIVDGPEEVRKRVREIIRAGANFIKVNASGGVFSPRDDPRHAHFRMDELTAVVTEARAAGIEVMAHAHGTEAIKNSVRAGIRSIEHGTYLDPEAVDLMSSHGTWLVPTLGVAHQIRESIKAGARVPDAIRAKLDDGIEAHAASFRLALEAGVRIAMGSDAAAEGHGRNLVELQLMHELGMPAPDVLRAATSSAAELMGIADRVGSIEPGKRGDLTLVAGDPHDFGGYPDNVRMVFKAGRQVRG
jgi:imidazolonepropionase-like amidohydrolase